MEHRDDKFSWQKVYRQIWSFGQGKHLAINGKYNDTKAYKNEVLWGTVGGTSHTSFSGGGTTTNFSSPKVDYSGHFLERAGGKEYPVTKKYNNYGSLGIFHFLIP